MIRRYPPWDMGSIFGLLRWDLAIRSQTVGVFLGCVVAVMNVGVVLEIGLGNGFTNMILMQALGQSQAVEKYLVSCDIERKFCEYVAQFQPPGGVNRQIVLGDSSKADWVQFFDGRRCGLVYIDGGHDYDFVVEDIRRTKLVLRDGGLMVLHDHWDVFPGIMKAVEEELGDYSKIQFPGNEFTNDTPFLVAQKRV